MKASGASATTDISGRSGTTSASNWVEVRSPLMRVMGGDGGLLVVASMSNC